ncbi:MAG: S8 family serine peptidase [Pseudobdellovibrionaceae bacterium]
MHKILFSRLFVLLLICAAALSGEAKTFKKKIYAPHVPNQLIVKFKNTSDKSIQNSFLQRMNAQVVQQFKSNGAVLIQLPNTVIQKNPQALELLAEKISASSEIEYVEPNWILHSTAVPNDPLYDELYALNKTASRSADIFAQEAWSKTTGSRDVLVAVIDSGVDYNHQDLADNYWHNPNEMGVDANGRDKSSNSIDDDNNGFIDDWRGWNFVENNNDPMDDDYHGTHCAGIIGAVGNNGVGVVGVNWNVSIVGLKFLDKSGSGTIANAVLAIEYATSLGVHIMNNSWGGDEYSETMAAAIQKANAAGILFVVAAGNDGNNNDVGLDYPSSYPIANVISVAATDSTGQMAGFSNFGAKTVHIAAPGVQILSTFPGNKYEKLDGTSMAAPHVSGAAALIKARFPQLSAHEIKARLMGGATMTPALQGQVVAGLLNIDNALEDDLTPPTVPQKISLLSATAASLNLEWENSLDQGSDKYAYSYEARRSTTPITTPAEWETATPVALTLLQNESSKVLARADIPLLNSSGYLTLRASDRFGNLSGLSRSIPYTMGSVSPIYANKGENLDGLSIEGTWGVEEVLGHGKVLSDSPGGPYGFGKTSTLTLPVFNISTPDVVISFNSKYDFELGYDFGYLELSTDQGETWQQVAIFNGARNWAQDIFPLNSFLKKEDTTMMLRFRVTSDATTSLDGWYLSDVSVFK